MTDLVNFYEVLAESLGISVGATIVLFAIISIWTLIWTGLALWKSARKKQLVWFIVLLVVNTMGILEILYIFLFSKIKLDAKKTAKKPSKKKK